MSSPVEVVEELSNVAYLSRLDDALQTTARVGGTRFGEFVHAGRGAFPTLVLERLRLLGLDSGLEPTDEALLPQPTPEPHPLNFEWYFTPKSADEIAAQLASEAG